MRLRRDAIDLKRSIFGRDLAGWLGCLAWLGWAQSFIVLIVKTITFLHELKITLDSFKYTVTANFGSQNSTAKFVQAKC